MKLKRNIYAFDVDGTLTKPGQGYSDYGNREPNPKLVDLALFYQKSDGNVIVITTARSEIIRNQTESWLRKHGINPEAVLMRANSDERPDPEVKVDQVRQLQAKYNGKITMYDDKPENCDAVRKMTGVNCVLVREP